MQRLLFIVAAIAMLLGLTAPAVLAADPLPDAGRVLVSVNGPVEIPAGDHLDALVVVGGDARISGDVRTIVVARRHRDALGRHGPDAGGRERQRGPAGRHDRDR